MGLITGFMGGAGGAAEFIGKTYLTDQVGREKDEANALRESNLKTSERVASQEFEAGENQKDRDSAERVSKTNATSKSKGNATNVMKNAAYYKSQGYPGDIADAAAGKNFKSVEDKDTGDEVLINTLTGKEVGRLTSAGGKFGKKAWVPMDEDAIEVQTEPTTANFEQASKEYNEKASMFESDESQFGMSETKWKKRRAEELSGGMINDQMKPEANKPAKKADKFVGDSPFPEGKVLKKDGKTYVVTNGKPVLKK